MTVQARIQQPKQLSSKFENKTEKLQPYGTMLLDNAGEHFSE